MEEPEEDMVEMREMSLQKEKKEWEEEVEMGEN